MCCSRSPHYSDSRMSSISPVSSFDDQVAIPTLRVMRLQSPALHTITAGSLDSECVLQNSLCLPDSLGVYVGETFTAYLGILNVSHTVPIRRLSVAAQLQTPSTRWQLPSSLSQSLDVEANSGVDTIVSHAIEEPGQHILRVEVGYLTKEGGNKTFRKFYRFQVVNPLVIQESVIRSGDSSCFVSLSVKYDVDAKIGPITLADVEFVPAKGLTATAVAQKTEREDPEALSALDLFDKADFLQPGSSLRFLFRVEASSRESLAKGIGAGDVLGYAMLTWRKAMGETGKITSPSIQCPAANPTEKDFLVHRSGFSADVTSAAAKRHQDASQAALSDSYPVTVEPISPPSRLALNIPCKIDFLVVNHSQQELTLQVQIALAEIADGLLICGNSSVTVGAVPPNGGSKVAAFKFLPVAPGLHTVKGCSVVDLVSGKEIPQPAFFQAYVSTTQ